MCILCVVQKWSRRVATMLPWLLFPLLGLWVFSHLLPPGFRFEFTSPRIACVLVLLVTIFWYEVLMPQLSAWRARNSAKYREMKRKEAIEMQKLRKIATRLCRNCLTPYRDQNPGGGKFMCSYCGHVSKRPVLDIPSGNGGDVDGKGGRKECSGIGCIFGNDVSQNGNSTRGHSVLRPNCKGRNAGEPSSGDDQCFATKFYGSASKSSNRIFVRFRRFWRNIFGLAVEDDASSDGDNEDMMFKEGENGIGYQESKGEKARRKAEEKRQARLERELLEEEERKQREEVAKLVDEQRRLRDEKMEAEKEYAKGSGSDRNKYSNKREAERKRQERRKEKDKGSSKSNSDCEEFDRKAVKDNDKKRESDKRSESGRKTTNVSVTARNSEAGIVSKNSNTHNPTSGNGSKYLDRVKGSFMASSKAFNGASFFGKAAHTSSSVVSKVGNHVTSIDHIQTASSRREVHTTEHLRMKLNANGDDKISKTNSYQPVALEIQQQTTPKKSWRQLFSRSPAVAPSPLENFSSGSNQKFQSIAQSSFLPSQASPSHPLADQISFGLPLPFSLSPFPNGSTGSSPVSSSVAEPMYPHLGELSHDLMSEEPDIFEDPCYVPDPVSLLGPVSESLDNFSLDLGSGYMKDTRFERPHGLKNLSPVEICKPSPIEAPTSRLRYVEERHTNYSSYPSTPKSQNVNTSPFNGSTNEDEDGMWKMWSTPPLGHDGFGLIGGSSSWLLPLGQNTPSQEEVFHPSAHKALTLQFPKENQVHSGTSSPQRLNFGNCQNGGMFHPLAPGSNDNDPWLQRSVFQPLPSDGQDSFPPLIPWEELPQQKVTFGDSSNSPSSYSTELSPGNRWSKKDCAVNGAGEGDGNLVARPHIGGLFSTPDVQSLWSYN